MGSSVVTVRVGGESRTCAVFIRVQRGYECDRWVKSGVPLSLPSSRAVESYKSYALACHNTWPSGQGMSLDRILNFVSFRSRF